MNGLLLYDPELKRLELENEQLRIEKRKQDLRRENERLRRQLGRDEGCYPTVIPRGRWPRREDFQTWC